MTTALVKSSTLIVMPSDSSGDPDTTKARIVELSGAPTFSDSYDSIERNVVRKAFSSYAPLRGLETTSQQVTIELHGSGSAITPPESALLYKSAFGALIGPTTPGTDWTSIVDDSLSTTIATGGTGSFSPVTGTDPTIYTCTITVADASGFQPHYPIRIYSGTTLKTIGFITEVDESADTIKFITENDSTLADNDTVDCGFLFSLRAKDLSQIADIEEANFDYYRGNITKEAWFGCRNTEFSIDFSTGQVCLPSFSFEGSQVGYSSAAYDKTTYGWTSTEPTSDSSRTSPLVIQLADVFMTDEDGNYFQECISNVQLSLTNEVYKKQCIASTGIGEVIRTSRSCSGSLNTFYVNKDFQQAFKDNEMYRLRALFNYASSLDASGDKVFSNKMGNIVAISIPQLKFSEVSVEEDSGIFKYANSFSCEPHDGDDELFFAFL